MTRFITLLVLAMCVAAHADMGYVHRVDEHIYRGKQPSDSDYPELARMGIKTVLDLRGGSIHEPRERKRAETAGMQYVSIRLSGVWEPHDEQIAHVLSVMEDSSKWPIYLHCWRGDDRVGMVVACYRIHFHHWTNEQALEEANHEHLNKFEVLMRRYIRSFDPSRIPQTTQAGLSEPRP